MEGGKQMTKDNLFVSIKEDIERLKLLKLFIETVDPDYFTTMIYSLGTFRFIVVNDYTKLVKGFYL